jgi:excisionase family DNA binding protein
MDPLVEYISPAEAATELRVSMGTIYSLLHDGRVPSVRVGSQWRISRRDLDMALIHGELAAVARQRQGLPGGLT